MFRNVFCGILLLAGIQGFTQFTVDNLPDQGNRTGLIGNMQGGKINYDKYKDVVDGTAFWKEYWCEAILTDLTGKEYPPVKVKLDLVADQVYFINPSGNEMILTTPMLYMKLKDSATGTENKLLRAEFFNHAKDAGITGWMQIYENGKAMLVKQLTRSLHSTLPYGTATAQVSIVEKGGWVVAVDKEAIQVKKLKEGSDYLVAKKPSLKGFKPTQKGMDLQLLEWVVAFNNAD